MAWKMIANSTFGVNKQQVVIKLSFWLVLSFRLVRNRPLKIDASGRHWNDSGKINAIFNNFTF